MRTASTVWRCDAFPTDGGGAGGQCECVPIVREASKEVRNQSPNPLIKNRWRKSLFVSLPSSVMLPGDFSDDMDRSDSLATKLCSSPSFLLFALKEVLDVGRVEIEKRAGPVYAIVSLGISFSVKPKLLFREEEEEEEDGSTEEDLSC
mmetsp:Transcript_5899/g.14094  ORF Transcript_5899/g.14094 Transcript_5899/m.14094 type:complete len:148 (-) Transcript_5899:454-897(-)